VIQSVKTCSTSLAQSPQQFVAHASTPAVHYKLVKYLGVRVHINGGKNLSFDIHTFIRSFYAAFNNIRAKALEEPVQLALFES